jgi:Rha family phage regulatory protein
LRDVENLECSLEFSQSNFGQTSYTDSQGRQQRMVEMTEDGFTLLAMGGAGHETVLLFIASVRPPAKRDAASLLGHCHQKSYFTP